MVNCKVKSSVRLEIFLFLYGRPRQSPEGVRPFVNYLTWLVCSSSVACKDDLKDEKAKMGVQFSANPGKTCKVCNLVVE